MAQQGGVSPNMGPTPGGKTAGAPTNPWDASSAAMRGQGALLANASRPGAMANAYGTYMNPYTSDVIDRTAADMQRQGQIGIRDLGSTAQGQGAFGGARHGLAEGTLMSEVNKNVGDLSSQMRQQGFGQAMQLAGQDVNNQMQGAAALGGYGKDMFSLGQNMTGQQAANGQQIADINNSLIGQAAGMFDRYTGQPTQSTMAILAALSGNPLSGAGTTTQTATPGTKSKIGAAIGTAGRVASGGKGG
jgi:hypothetical protein